MIHSFLLIGQSNMAGRGKLTEAPRLDNLGGRLQVLRNGRWQGMFRPINPDRAFSGTCLAESFAKAYALDHPEVEVGVIPCADGGTRIDQWEAGSLLFDNAVFQTKLAQRTSHLAGILWHQGEGDCPSDRYPFYYDKLVAMAKALRQAVGAEELPFLVGGLGDFLKDRTESPQLVNYPHINAALQRFALDTPYCTFVGAQGLTANPDNLHFNWKSLEEFGLRYYQAFCKIDAPTLQNEAEEKEFDGIRSDMEAL